MEQNSGGIFVVLLLVLIWLPGISSSICNTTGDRLLVGEREECVLPVGHYALSEVKVDGSVRVTGNGRLTLNVSALFIGANGSVRADGNGHGAENGTGAGTPDGSGGNERFLSRRILFQNSFFSMLWVSLFFFCFLFLVNWLVLLGGGVPWGFGAGIGGWKGERVFYFFLRL